MKSLRAFCPPAPSLKQRESYTGSSVGGGITHVGLPLRSKYLLGPVKIAFEGDEKV